MHSKSGHAVNGPTVFHVGVVDEELISTASSSSW
jgi:hypothetical protein